MNFTNLSLSTPTTVTKECLDVAAGMYDSYFIGEIIKFKTFFFIILIICFILLLRIMHLKNQITELKDEMNTFPK